MQKFHVVFVGNIERVMIESCQCPNNTTHNGHWGASRREATEKELKLFMHHGVIGDAFAERFVLFGGSVDRRIKEDRQLHEIHFSS